MSVPSSLSECTVAPGALAPLPGSVEIERTLRAALARDADPHAAAALANLLVREHRYGEALALYERAVELDPAFASAWIAAADLAYVLRDEARSETALAHALSLCRYYPDPDPQPRPLRLVMLMRDAAYSINAPLELLLDRREIAIDRCYVDGYGGRLPRDAVAMTAFGTWDDAASAVAAATPLARINDPRNLARAGRERLAQSLEGIAGVRAVPARPLAREELDALTLPALVRPRGTHAGRGLALIGSREDLAAHARRFPAHRYDVCPFIEYRSDDGYYRKYRFIVVDGVALPYHLAVSPRWMVHYQGSAVGEHAWMRREELAFLADPSSVFPSWERITDAIARALGLDYVGLDVTREADGTMLVFEADPAMLVHDEDERGALGYKRPFVRAIRDELMRLIASRVR